MNLITIMGDYMEHWTRYVDNAITTNDSQKIQTAFAKLNSFHQAIQFTYECEQNISIISWVYNLPVTM